MRVLLFTIVLAAGCGSEHLASSFADAGGQALDVDVDAGVPERPDPPPPIEVCHDASPLADADLPRCTAATRDCISACPSDGDDCRNACWAGDATAPDAAGVNCNSCIFTQLLACLDANSCHDEVAAFYCCLVDACSTGTPGCDQQCTTEVNAMFTCGAVNSPQCVDLVGGEVGECYAAADPGDVDAGTLDGGT
ncbi:MAG TPA: hypothetical protein VGO62_06895 [Myxococcota bacterium]|jgi:hypothetical protein